MDIDLARTFLEVVNAGSFVAAAPRLNVTQSTVSTRIRLLEEQLGVTLFARNKDGAALTAAGIKFERAATALVRIWEQARQDAALPPGYDRILRIGGEAGLWYRWLHQWIPWMRQHAPGIALHCLALDRERLIECLLEGELDVAVMFSPQARPNLRVERLAEEELVLVAADSPPRAAPQHEHIHVNWGEEFGRMYRLSFPDAPSPALSISLSTVAFDYLMSAGGTGYFPRTLAAPHLASGAVRIVAGAESLRLPVYAVHPANADPDIVGPGLAGIRAVLAEKESLSGAPAGNA